jgi:membrane-bound lytic murein transglycosylase B
MPLGTLAFRVAVVFGLTAVGLYGSVFADYTAREDVRAYIHELVAEHGFSEQELLTLFASAERKESIRRAMARPAEKRLKWHEYRAIFLQEPRIRQGLEFWNANAERLTRAESDFGVPPEYVVAIIGVETKYGRVVGSYRVVDALMTLAFDYPEEAGRSRADFFRAELTQFLLLAREEGKDPLSLKGSYAGAMGYGQFIPSSYRAYAVDFDADGLRDIWGNEADAIGSVANYFSRHGWRAGEPTVLRVEVDGPVAALANESLELNHTVGELRALGLVVDDVDDSAAAALFRMDQEDHAEYWLGLNNFYVITRYNRSRLYALAVHQLAEAIREARLAEQNTLTAQS